MSRVVTLPSWHSMVQDISLQFTAAGLKCRGGRAELLWNSDVDVSRT